MEGSTKVPTTTTSVILLQRIAILIDIVDDNLLGFAALTSPESCALGLRGCIVEADVGSSGETRGTGWAAVDFCCEDGVDECVGESGVASLNGEPAGGGGCG